MPFPAYIVAATAILEKFHDLVFVVHQELGIHHLTVNFKVGKTQPLVALRGAGAKSIPHGLFVEQRGCFLVELACGTHVSIEVADIYEHLGTKFTAREEMGPELKARDQAAKRSKTPFLVQVLKYPENPV